MPSDCPRCKGVGFYGPDGDEVPCVSCAAAMIEYLVRRVDLLERLLACYRTNRRPSEKLLTQLTEMESKDARP